MKYLRSNKLCAIWEISSNGHLEHTVYRRLLRSLMSFVNTFKHDVFAY